jgi:hypothetical protein
MGRLNLQPHATTFTPTPNAFSARRFFAPAAVAVSKLPSLKCDNFLPNLQLPR